MYPEVDHYSINYLYIKGAGANQLKCTASGALKAAGFLLIFHSVLGEFM